MSKKMYFTEEERKEALRLKRHRWYLKNKEIHNKTTAAYYKENKDKWPWWQGRPGGFQDNEEKLKDDGCALVRPV
jgi:CHASE2 domain-containing sensor protein